MTVYTQWVEVSEERYEEMLGALPPLDWWSKGFLVGEANSHRACRVSGRVTADYQAFVKIVSSDGETTYYASKECLTRQEWAQITLGDIVINVISETPSVTADLPEDKPTADELNVLTALQNRGFAVVVWSPAELGQVDPEFVQERLISMGYDVIEMSGGPKFEFIPETNKTEK